MYLVAQTTQPTTQPGKSPPWWITGGSNLMFPLLIGLLLLFVFTSSKNKRKDEKTRQDMLKNLKRGDRVQTIGGIIGTVVDAREGDVVLKVDESSNTKIKFAREAIKRVMAEDEPAAAK
jgi:preprotein translocase subunit YajC